MIILMIKSLPKLKLYPCLMRTSLSTLTAQQSLSLRLHFATRSSHIGLLIPRPASHVLLHTPCMQFVSVGCHQCCPQCSSFYDPQMSHSIKPQATKIPTWSCQVKLQSHSNTTLMLLHCGHSITSYNLLQSLLTFKLLSVSPWSCPIFIHITLTSLSHELSKLHMCPASPCTLKHIYQNTMQGLT